MFRLTFFRCLVLSFAIILIAEITKEIVNFDKLLHISLAEKLTSQQIESFFELQDKWQWVSFVFMPIYLLMKTSFIASILYIGTFFFAKKELPYKSLWAIAVKAEFIFLLVAICKIIWFYFIQTNYTLKDIQYFFPLSALNIIGYNELEPWLIYPLQTLNLFELAYIVYLSYQIGGFTKTNADTGLKIVASSYVPALFLWVVVIMFTTLNYL